MTKTIRLALTAALSLCAAAHSHAQLFIGAGASVHSYKDLRVYPGVQVRAGLEANAGRFTTNLGYSYGVGSKDFSFNVPYSDPSGLSVQSVPFKQEIRAANFFLHTNINFGNDEQAFQPGVILGMSLDEFKVKYDAGDAPVGYSSSIAGSFTDTTFGTVKVDLGIKGNYRLGPGAVFAEALIGLPVAKLGADVGETLGLTHYGLNIGYKLYVGPWRFEYRNRY
jgi:hypothetical protein